MTLETAGGIASIAAIIIDVASFCLRLHERFQKLPSALNDLQTDVDHLEKILTLRQNAENEQRQSHPQNISRDTREIVKNCHHLRSEIARDISLWKRDRYMFGYNWKSVYLFLFRQRRMRYVLKHVQDCLCKISVVASIAAWYLTFPGESSNVPRITLSRRSKVDDPMRISSRRRSRARMPLRAVAWLHVAAGWPLAKWLQSLHYFRPF